ncbi:hypothetical protein SARC_03870, partial [Sphaeroforma arctica JP610]
APPGPDEDTGNTVNSTGNNKNDTQVEDENKANLINQVLELQNTLDELSQRVTRVKDENAKLKSENQVLTQYIDNLMASSTAMHGSASKANNAAMPAPPKKGLSSFFGLGGAKKPT